MMLSLKLFTITTSTVVYFVGNSFEKKTFNNKKTHTHSTSLDTDRQVTRNALKAPQHVEKPHENSKDDKTRCS